MTLNPYIFFNGKCAEAFAFYAKVLHGKIVFSITYGESPMAEKMPKEEHGKVMHAHLLAGTMELMGSDNCMGYEAPQGFSLSINLSDTAEAERIFRELSEGGKINHPFGETFWAVRFGMLVDQFGIPWMVNCAKQR